MPTNIRLMMCVRRACASQTNSDSDSHTCTHHAEIVVVLVWAKCFSLLSCACRVHLLFPLSFTKSFKHQSYVTQTNYDLSLHIVCMAETPSTTTKWCVSLTAELVLSLSHLSIKLRQEFNQSIVVSTRTTVLLDVYLSLIRSLKLHICFKLKFKHFPLSTTAAIRWERRWRRERTNHKMIIFLSSHFICSNYSRYFSVFHRRSHHHHYH